MRRSSRRIFWHFGLMASSILGSNPATAFEAAGVPALQLGPVGEGVAFTSYQEVETEVQARLLTLTGEERRGTRHSSLSGQASEVALGAGFAVTKDLQFVMRAMHRQQDVSLHADSDQPTSPGTPESLQGRRDQVSEILAGPSLWFGPLLLGAHASILALGEEHLETETTEATYAKATMPLMRLYAGLRSGPITAMVGARLYNDVHADADAKRRSPAEVSFNGRLAGGGSLSPLQVGGYLTLVQAERASDGTLNDYFKYGAGGLYRAVPWLALAGGLHYTDPHYRDDVSASSVAGNLGGMRIDIGAHYSWLQTTANFGLGYSVPQQASYADATTGEKSRLERAEWDLALGLVQSW